MSLNLCDLFAPSGTAKYGQHIAGLGTADAEAEHTAGAQPRKGKAQEVRGAQIPVTRWAMKEDRKVLPKWGEAQETGTDVYILWLCSEGV